MPVDSPHVSYDEMFPRWKKCRDFYDGEAAVKSEGDVYLPRIGGSPPGGATTSGSPKLVTRADRKYEAYKDRALFFNATRRTIDGLSGAIFQKSLTVNAPRDVEDELEDATLSNMPIGAFALRIVQELMITGRDGVLISHNGERPFWRTYEAENIISWRSARVDGVEVVTRVVLREQVDREDPEDEFKVEIVEQFRVLDLFGGFYRQRLFRRKAGRDQLVQVGIEDNAGNEVDEFFAVRRGERLRFIPFTFLGPLGLSVNVMRPPLEDLVNINVSHYQTSADLEWGLHFTALPTPVIMGEQLGSQQSGPLEIGSTIAWQLQLGADAKMLEFTGAGLGSLSEREQEKRKMMATQGARMLEDQPAQAETLGAVALRHAGESANLKTVAGATDQGLTLALRWHVWWGGVASEPDDKELMDVAVSTNKDFVNVKASPQEVQQAMLLVQADLIAYETFYHFIQQGEWARPDITAKDELQDITNGNEARMPFQMPPPQPTETEAELL